MTSRTVDRDRLVQRILATMYFADTDAMAELMTRMGGKHAELLDDIRAGRVAPLTPSTGRRRARKTNVEIPRKKAKK